MTHLRWTCVMKPPWRKTFFDKESLVAGPVLHNWCLQTMCTSPFPVGYQVGTGVCNESKEDGHWRFCAPRTMGATCKMAIVVIFLTNECCKRFWYPFHGNLAFFALFFPTIAIIVLDSCQESLSDALLTTDLNQITTANVIYQTEFIIDLIQSKNTPRCWKLRSNLLLRSSPSQVFTMFCHCRDPTVNRDAELLTQLVSLAQGSLDSWLWVT